MNLNGLTSLGSQFRLHRQRRYAEFGVDWTLNGNGYCETRMMQECLIRGAKSSRSDRASWSESRTRGMALEHLKGLSPGELVVGNSVYSLGFVGGIGAGLKLAFGGEVTQITQIIHEGRQQSYARMVEEVQQRGGAGITGVTSELRAFHGNIEFLSVASCVHAADQKTEKLLFSTSGDGQELYCLLDAGYSPRKFVFGNVAYSTGIGGGLLGSLKSLARGEIKEFSDIFNTTRHLALARIAADASAADANAVVGIETEIMPFRGISTNWAA